MLMKLTTGRCQQWWQGCHLAEQENRPLHVHGWAQRQARLSERRHQGVPLLHLHGIRVAGRPWFQETSCWNPGSISIKSICNLKHEICWWLVTTICFINRCLGTLTLLVRSEAAAKTSPDSTSTPLSLRPAAPASGPMMTAWPSIAILHPTNPSPVIARHTRF